jgi:uncharacterized UPF0146 family protein
MSAIVVTLRICRDHRVIDRDLDMNLADTQNKKQYHATALTRARVLFKYTRATMVFAITPDGEFALKLMRLSTLCSIKVSITPLLGSLA